MNKASPLESRGSIKKDARHRKCRIKKEEIRAFLVVFYGTRLLSVKELMLRAHSLLAEILTEVSPIVLPPQCLLKIGGQKRFVKTSAVRLQKKCPSKNQLNVLLRDRESPRGCAHLNERQLRCLMQLISKSPFSGCEENSQVLRAALLVGRANVVRAAHRQEKQSIHHT